jgi:hypothetical protein
MIFLGFILSVFQDSLSAFANRIVIFTHPLSASFTTRVSPGRDPPLRVIRGLLQLHRGLQLSFELPIPTVRVSETNEDALLQLVKALLESFCQISYPMLLSLLCRIPGDASGGLVLTWNEVIEKWMHLDASPALLRILILLLQHIGFPAKFPRLSLTVPLFKSVMHRGDVAVAIPAFFALA